MDPLTHFRGHNCVETNTHTQHEGLLSLYVHAYVNVCVRAYIYICFCACTCMYKYTLQYMHICMFIQCHICIHLRLHLQLPEN